LRTAFGIDIGGSGIKGAEVDLDGGRMLTSRIRIPTPQPATPESVAEVIQSIITQARWKGPVGCAFPGVVQQGTTRLATNLDPSWEGARGEEELQTRLGLPIHMINDADAAGLAEMTYGAGKTHGEQGVVLMLTFGTGIGSAIFVDGRLVPNTELGELELNGYIAETRAAGRLREDGELNWEEWTERVQEYLTYVEKLFSPNLIIFGGGISALSAEFLPNLRTNARLVPAELLNNAGIVGAAYAADGV
jgi:polyphosphate glucokinase